MKTKKRIKEVIYGPEYISEIKADTPDKYHYIN